MKKEEIRAELTKLANKVAELTEAILRLEECWGVRVTIDVTNIRGKAKIKLDVKTSARNSPVIPEAKAVSAAEIEAMLNEMLKRGEEL
jgi:hypothetical protein